LALIARSDFYGRPCHTCDVCEITNEEVQEKEENIWHKAIITASVPSVKNRDKTVLLLITYFLIAGFFSHSSRRAKNEEA